MMILCIIGCSADEEKTNHIEECSKIDKSKIIPEEDLNTVCNFTSVYRYECELFLTCNCCLCLKFVPPINCEGVAACKGYDGCQDFYRNAEYLFSMTDE